MTLPFDQIVFFVLAAALAGGLTAKLVKIPPLIGYIVFGIIFGALLPKEATGIGRIAEIGIILLLFSTGIELSLEKLGRVGKVAIFGGILQVALVTIAGYFILSLFGFNHISSLVLAYAFSLSSTAVIVKILIDRGETETLHGEIMVGWSLVQDLTVIPMMVVLPTLAGGGGISLALGALGKAAIVVFAVVLLGRLIAPAFIHKIASFNSRELLSLSAFAFAIGTAVATSFFGISPALGAFLAGVVISESQENHAVFAETRPLKDLFMAIFFVALGFLVTPGVIISNFWLILFLAALAVLLKIAIVFIVNLLFRIKGRAGVAVSLGLSQIGEFSFIVFSSALALGLITHEVSSIGIAVTIVTLMAAPVLFDITVPVWRKLKGISIFSGGEKRQEEGVILENHIIICGYGRVGGWVGKAFETLSIPFCVVEYNQKVVNELSKKGTNVIYGDPVEPDVLEAAGIRKAKAIILAIPDRMAQETLIAHVQTITPSIKIISRVHLDEDWEKLKALKVDKIIQPEFEAAVAIVRAVLTSMGRPKEEVSRLVKGMRLSHWARSL